MILEQFEITQPERQKYHLNATLRVLKEIDPNMVVSSSIKSKTFFFSIEIKKKYFAIIV